MSFSIDVLVLYQEEIQEYTITKSFRAKAYHESTEKDIEELYEEYGQRLVIPETEPDYFYDSMKGKWYTLGKNDDGLVWAFGLIDTDFGNPLSISAPWIDDEDDFEAFTPVRVKKEFQEDLFVLLSEMLDTSPNKTLLVHPRYQSGDVKIIQGPIPLEKYFKLLIEEKIPFNVYTMVQR